MLFWVYSLRYLGRRRTGGAVSREGFLGDVVMEPYEAGWNGRPMQLVRLLKPGTDQDILPSMVDARVMGIRRTLLISGMEQVTSGRKSVERYRQTWLCAHERADRVGCTTTYRPTTQLHRLRPGG